MLLSRQPAMATSVRRFARVASRPHVAAQASAIANEEGSNNAIKVVTYNLLSDKYTGWQAQYCSKEHLVWSRRRELIKQELQGYDANIVCLQEVEDRVFYDELQPWFKTLGMQGWYMARQSGELAGPPEGVAMFVSDTMFKVERQASARFSDYAHEVASLARTGSDGWRLFTQKEEGVVMAVLQHIPSGQRLVAACTHLFWNPRYPDVKALQAMVLCSQLSRFACSAGGVSRPDELPLVLGGDFNSLPQKQKPDMFDKVIAPGPDGLVSGVYHLLRHGTLSTDHPHHPHTYQTSQQSRDGSGELQRSPTPPATAAISTAACDAGSGHAGNSTVAVADRPATHAAVAPEEGLQLHTSGLQLDSMHRIAHGREPALTTKTNNFAGCLDYIWISPQWFQVQHVLSLPYLEPASTGPIDPLTDIDFPPIPDAHFPSDHLAMGCVLELLPQRCS